MAPLQIDNTPYTLRQFNQSRLMASEIIKGKEFRRLRRKQRNK